ncbi:aromatic ring-hydroxylating dioxygenase subunit alpha [uncultured Azohydromonas sp.]|jgi:Phenylpropionate dioxygenase and related ring-hydroxylating dioxygenases, large terminal subunit|uniref:aromatic ring-hydroxylating dioxygenase subunit alpha n=1 Tax=uncultured Azohydromonas sp. TaxID=487342 RepID=UPI0026146800|nr:aromatic ring-hydroxylating dioxygenase subunit alpha [uncultured Azohydromonas sp.]
MLSAEKNRRLTEVGPGTPMGELLRRYWHPVAGIDELERHPVKAVRLMGEDLVLFKDAEGAYGLVDRHCAHRRADLSYGFVEPGGLRCNYHGWQFDVQGRCVHQPFEEAADPQARAKCKVRLKAYRVQPLAGMLWAYMGPEPAPLLPDWEAFSWANGFVQVVFSEVPCNWLQAQENSIDPVHFEWMHANWGRRLRGAGGHAPRHLRLGFEEFEFGFTYRRISEDTDEQHPLWTIGRVCLWPNGFFLGDHFEWRVPVDDTHMLSVTWSFIRVPREAEPYVQRSIPSWTSPIKDAATGRWITTHVINQDIVAWVGQGPVTDRSQENLGASDRGIALLRRRLFDDMDAVAQGLDPKGLIRDPERNRRVFLPSDSREFFLRGLPRAEYERHPKWSKLLHHFIFHAGQPEAVQRACEEATGVAIRAVDVVDI